MEDGETIISGRWEDAKVERWHIESVFFFHFGRDSVVDGIRTNLYSSMSRSEDISISSEENPDGDRLSGG